MKNIIFTFLLLLGAYLSFAQQLNGNVIDAINQEPISGASVYIDGTSIGTITDIDGNFNLNYPEGIEAPVIIRMMGYETLRYSDPKNENFSKVILVQKADELDAIILELDPWSRQKKENIFKEYFLGTSRYSRDCEILNLNKIRLRFNPSTGLLTAKCKEPIRIQNEYLGYIINYDLIDFEVQFNRRNLKSDSVDVSRGQLETIDDYRFNEAFYIGSSFFEEMDIKKSKSKRVNKRRNRLYAVSSLRFFRALSKDSLKENDYSLFYNRALVESKEHLRVRQLNGLTFVNFRHVLYALFDHNNNRTDILLTGEQIIIDQYGNNRSGRAIKFNGFLADLRVGGMLPLDYVFE